MPLDVHRFDGLWPERHFSEVIQSAARCFGQVLLSSFQKVFLVDNCLQQTSLTFSSNEAACFFVEDDQLAGQHPNL